MPSNLEDPNFPTDEMKLIQVEVYNKLSLMKQVCPQQPLNMGFFARNEYFSDSLWVAKNLFLERLMTEQQHYRIPMVQQFFATVVFDEDDLRSFEWMTCRTVYSSYFREFGTLLGYEFVGAEVPVGRHMHQVGVDPNNGRLAPIYNIDGVPGRARGTQANLQHSHPHL